MKVHVGLCQDYGDSQRTILRALEELGGADRFFRKGQKVVLKPNLLKGAPPEKAVTTHPDFIISVVRIVEDAGARAVIIDSPGGPGNKRFLQRCYEKSEWTRIPRETGAELSYDVSYSQVPLPHGRILKSVPVLKVIQEADVIINLPKLKTHGLTVYTGAVKNMYGTVPGMTKPAFHGQYRGMHRFARMLLDVHDASSPDLSIMDGIVGMEGKGPAGGDPIKMNMVLTSQSAQALDMAACRATGIDISKVPTIRMGDLDPKDVELIGDTPPKMSIKHPVGGMVPWWVPEFMGGIFANMYMKRPVLYPDRCISCGDCERICPEDAITMKKLPRISWSKCIRCYCCAEICPKDALEPR